MLSVPSVFNSSLHKIIIPFKQAIEKIDNHKRILFNIFLLSHILLYSLIFWILIWVSVCTFHKLIIFRCFSIVLIDWVQNGSYSLAFSQIYQHLIILSVWLLSRIIFRRNISCRQTMIKLNYMPYNPILRQDWGRGEGEKVFFWLSLNSSSMIIAQLLALSDFYYTQSAP